MIDPASNLLGCERNGIADLPLCWAYVVISASDGGDAHLHAAKDAIITQVDGAVGRPVFSP